MKGDFIVNGIKESCDFAGSSTLLKVLRSLGHSEVKEGCGEGQCGACLVLLDDHLVNSCQVLAGSALDRKITTVKGIGTATDPHPIQNAYVDAGAVQCGFCTPGMVLATYALLQSNPDPPDEQIKKALDGNLCRCTGYVKIIEAVKLAARRIGDGG